MIDACSVGSLAIQFLGIMAMEKFVLCSHVIEIKVKGFTYWDAFQRQELLRQSMLHIMCIGIDRQDKQIKAKGGKGDDDDWGFGMGGGGVIESGLYLH